MGYGFYTINAGPEIDRPCGYLVLATCDKRGCNNEIDRGLGYLCGSNPHDFWSDEQGCGRYYCEEHAGWIGPRGGCTHGRRGKAWGKTLSDLVPNPDGTIVCCERIGHEGAHAWAAEEEHITLKWAGGDQFIVTDETP